MTVSATHDARHAATAASARAAAVRQDLGPGLAVAGCPAATPRSHGQIVGREATRQVPSARDRGLGSGVQLPSAARGPRRRSTRGGAWPHQGSEAGTDREARHGPDDTGLAAGADRDAHRRINELTEHLRTHPNDHYSRRGLLKLVGRRRRFLNYLQRNDLEGYRALIKELGLRR